MTGFDAARATRRRRAGGSELVDPATMESAVRPGLFFGGSMLNVDGVSRSPNPQACWSRGVRRREGRSGALPPPRPREEGPAEGRRGMGGAGVGGVGRGCGSGRIETKCCCCCFFIIFFVCPPFRRRSCCREEKAESKSGTEASFERKCVCARAHASPVCPGSPPRARSSSRPPQQLASVSPVGRDGFRGSWSAIASFSFWSTLRSSPLAAPEAIL